MIRIGVASGKRILFTAVALAGVLAATPALAWQRTDVITLDNGDRITGEIRGSSRGKLQLRTTALGTIDIKWEHVVAVESDKVLEIEMSSGARYFGSVQPSDEQEKLEVSNPAGDTALETQQVASVRPIGRSFWRRFDGSLDLGMSATQASSQLEYSLNLKNEIGGTRNRFSTNIVSSVKKVEDETTTNRQQLDASWIRDMRWAQWFSIVMGSLQHNDELNLDFRSTVGGGVGRYILQSSRHSWAVFGSGLFSQERYAGDDSTPNGEVAAGTSLQIFIYGDHDIDLNTSFQVIPSLTDAGRVRMSLNSSISYELFRDFYLGLNVFDQYDSRPPQTGAEKNDVSVTTSIGYKW